MRKCKISIVISEFNKKISDNLLKGALDAYDNIIGGNENITIYKVPGAFEIPGTIIKILEQKTNKYDAILTLGSVIKGKTAHFEHISSSVTNTLSLISLSAKIPVIYGILTTYNLQQALKRSDPKRLNKGAELMKATIKTIETYNNIL